MKNFRSIGILVLLIAAFSTIAAATGIFYNSGSGPYQHESIRGSIVDIFGKGLYQHMSADVAIQGIAHDYVTLFIAVPCLLLAFHQSKRGNLKAVFFLAGILKYFFLTYLFYMNMGMYNFLFLVYIILTSCSFFALILTLLEIDISTIKRKFSIKTPVKWIGSFLIFLSSAIALLWLEIIVSPLLDGSLIPVSVEHYTTLTVQGFDLSIFLPIAFLSGIFLIQKRSYGYFMAGVTLIFLCFLMSALVAKIVAMALAGANVVPVIFIIPTFLILSVTCSIIFFRNINLEVRPRISMTANRKIIKTGL